SRRDHAAVLEIGEGSDRQGLTDADFSLPGVDGGGEVKAGSVLPEVHIIFQRDQPLSAPESATPLRRILRRSSIMRLAVRDAAARIEPQARPRASSVDEGVIREHPFAKRAALTFRQAAGATTWLPAVYRRARPVVRVLTVGCAILLILPYLLTP